MDLDVLLVGFDRLGFVLPDHFVVVGPRLDFDDLVSGGGEQDMAVGQTPDIVDFSRVGDLPLDSASGFDDGQSSLVGREDPIAGLSVGSLVQRFGPQGQI